MRNIFVIKFDIYCIFAVLNFKCTNTLFVSFFAYTRTLDRLPSYFKCFT